MGEPLLKACAENGTDYVDITGEHDWVRTMWLRYDAVAKKHQARLIPCCGYDFILNDVGIAAVHEELKPCKLLDVAQHCPMGKSLPSKGTLRTILETLYQLPLAKILSPSTLRCGTLFLPHYVPLMKSWIHPTVMSQSITSYIRSWRAKKAVILFKHIECAFVSLLRRAAGPMKRNVTDTVSIGRSTRESGAPELLAQRSMQYP